MHRRRFLLAACSSLCVGLPALAQDFAQNVVTQLRAQGFSRIAISRTLLGRTRILASGADGQREIILNPRTGEILRDLWIANGSAGSSSSGRTLVNDGGSSGHGGDDHDDDTKDDSKSGSGNSGSGSGSGSSGSSGGDDSGGDDGEDD